MWSRSGTYCMPRTRGSNHYSSYLAVLYYFVLPSLHSCEPTAARWELQIRVPLFAHMDGPRTKWTQCYGFTTRTRTFIPVLFWLLSVTLMLSLAAFHIVFFLMWQSVKIALLIDCVFRDTNVRVCDVVLSSTTVYIYTYTLLRSKLTGQTLIWSAELSWHLQALELS